MNLNNREKQKGFAALVSTVLISSVLMVLAASVARGAFRARFDALSRENKKISRMLGEACVQAALLKLAQDKDYGVLPEGEEIIVDGDKICRICEVNDLGGSEWEIFTRAVWQNTYTNLKTKAALTGSEFVIISTRETAPYFSSCAP
jgi:hypothetical protein